jgi:hypothetical protein
MNDLSPRAEHLLDLAREADVPDARRRRKVRAGLSAALGAGALSPAAKAALLMGASKPASVGGVQLAIRALGWIKTAGVGVGAVGWLVGGASVGVAGVAVAVSAHHFAASTQAVPVTSSALPVPRSTTDRNRPAPAPTSAELSRGPEPNRARALPVQAGAQGSSVAQSGTLTEETHLLDQAQLALRSGDTDRTLALIEEHDRRFGAGLLREEAHAARVLALCRAGRVEDGRARAEEFTREFPGSPLLPRVRRVCDGSRETLPAPGQR